MAKPGPKPRPLADRFWSKVAVGALSECWEWRAARTRGYGQFRVVARPASPHRAHRVAWALACGKIPDGVWVLHKCDNPLCCNPAHLFLGSQVVNMADAAEKGRTAHGRRNGSTKLDQEKVCEIRKRYATGLVTQQALADASGVSQTNISCIVRRVTWAWLT